MRQRVFWVLLGVGAVCIVIWSIAMATAAAPVRRVSGSLVFWDQARGFASIVANAELLTEISPYWYHVGENARVEPYRSAGGGSYEDPAILAFLRSRGILVIPTVANIHQGHPDGPLVSRTLATASLRDAHVAGLVQLAVTNNYDGLDIDYEGLDGADRDAFTAFITQLGGALHASGKRLTVNVYAKTAEPGTWGGPMAQDYAAIGRAADEVRLMTYEHHWASSAPGPIAPIDWVANVLTFARSVIPAHKIILGVPLYGYDWVGTTGTPLVWRDTVAIADRHRAPTNWDTPSASPWLRYTSGRDRHTIWFENVLSVAAKLRLATRADIGGVMLWRLAGEDPAVWPAIRTHVTPAVPAPLAAE